MSEKIILAEPDKQRFEMLKQAVTDGLAICYTVGDALREIKDRQFYAADGFKTFEDFCNGTWGWTKRYCNQLICDAAAINSLPQGLRKLITSHAAAAALAKIDPVLRVVVVEDAAAANPGKKSLTNTDIKNSSPPPRKPKSGSKPASSPPPRKNKPAAGKPGPKPKGPVDATGLEIPAECLELWNTGVQAQELITYTSSALRRLKEEQDNKNLLFVEVDFTDNIAMLNRLITDLKRAKPYAVCPSCQGKLLDKDCICKGRGFVSEHYWKTFVPEEVKKLRGAK